MINREKVIPPAAFTWQRRYVECRFSVDFYQVGHACERCSAIANLRTQRHTAAHKCAAAPAHHPSFGIKHLSLGYNEP